MIINRTWAMPNKHTFLIKPISVLITKYVNSGKGWIDPYAGENSPAEITNDLNQDKPTKYHMEAKEFLMQLTGQYEGCLFDPPYSFRQIKECYNGIGLKVHQRDTQISFYSEAKNLIAKLIKPNGIVICFGWNSMGLGKNRGFEIIEILLVAHGGTKNDTIITVEKKIQINLNI